MMESLTIKPQLGLAQVNLNNTDKNISNVAAMCLGRFDTSHIYRILFKVPITTIPDDVTIVQASLKIYIAASGIGQSNLVTPYLLSNDWLIDSVTWNNQPAFDGSVSGSTEDIGACGEYTFDITSIVKAWYDETHVNYGLILKNRESKNATYAKVLTDLHKSYAPLVEIKYIFRCKCECKVISTQFIETVEEMDTDSSYSYSLTKDTSKTKMVTFFIKNEGMYTVTAKIQISPDGINYSNDYGGVAINIKPGEMLHAIPAVFSKYTRLAVKNTDSSQLSRVKIWYQAQQ
ncbi:DUF6385 domain-containing protein [Petroclostridium sp. X23]|uniref:DUF6385 domain-containing protein n=1 Tax=Petroclostridium sp. X23 TaxID=3045146 RepID=UPI0024AD105E|nr:DUF6385 domain-containing protein [Petroclostridium sp. X23]WHH58245.1 DUF6385 domain-containing protein [Petroclostridium sp. X23]